ncbi:hypothetical protein LA080_000157 [Diaporthe eres]|nr:hypothetical protein LA080_000157 [Diaporthe eres]
MSNREDRGRGSYRRDQQGASDNPLQHYAQEALESMGEYSSSPWPDEAQQYSSTPAASGYVIQQPRPAPYQQGQLGGNTLYGGGYADTAQYSGSRTGEPQPLPGGYPGSAHQQTTEEHKRARESSSSSGDQQHEHGRSHHRHKKADHGRGEHHHHSSGGHHHSRHHGSQRSESQGGGRSHHEPRHQPENQGPNFTPPAPQYQPNPQQNTSWPTNAPATAGYGGGAPRSYGDDVYTERQSGLPAGFSPPGARGQLPPMQLERPQLAPMSSLLRQQRRRDEQLPPMLPEPHSGGLPSLQIEPRQPAPMQPPVPTGTGAGLAEFHSHDSLDRFNVVWHRHIFDTSQERPTRALTPLQLREARVVIASFATWDEVTQLGQQLPGGRLASTIAPAVKHNYGSQWGGLRQWREWTRDEDLILWQHRISPRARTEQFVQVATQIHGDFPDRMLGEVVGRLKLFTRLGEHPDPVGRTIGGFPTLGLSERNRARRN